MFLFCHLVKLYYRDRNGYYKLWNVDSWALLVCYKMLVYHRKFTIIHLLYSYVKWKLLRFKMIINEWDSIGINSGKAIQLCMQDLQDMFLLRKKGITLIKLNGQLLEYRTKLEWIQKVKGSLQKGTSLL